MFFRRKSFLSQRGWCWKYKKKFFLEVMSRVCLLQCLLIGKINCFDVYLMAVISTVLFQMIYHYNDVIMSAMSSQITSLSIVYSTVYSRRRSKKHQSSASLAFVRGIHRWPVNSPHKGPVTRKMFPFDDVMVYCKLPNLSTWKQVAFSVKMVWYIHETYRRLHALSLPRAPQRTCTRSP